MNKSRIVMGFAIIAFLFLALTLRLSKIMIIDADDLSRMAISQQTKDTTIPAKRGVIYDRNGKELATSTICYTLYGFPQTFRGEDEDKEVDKNIEDLMDAIGLTDEEARASFYDSMKNGTSITTLAKHLTKEQTQAIRALKLRGLDIAEATMRFYPLGNFASQVLGSVNDDGEGRTGLEMEYNDYLSGVNGRWVTNTDVSGNELVEGTERLYEARDGLNIVTTLDEAIQYYCQKEAEAAYTKWKAKKVEVLAMDPKTGEILASVVWPGFDPNDAFTPQGLSAEEMEAFGKMTEDEKVAYLFKMWRNPIVSDTYEPGSTFKLVTASAGLDSKVMGMEDTFYCDGSFDVADYTLNCWYLAGHGVQNTTQAIGNSCNPALAEVGRRLGASRFKNYIQCFGFGSATGVDYPGEATGLIQSTIGPVELANMSFGQGIAVTPVQLVSAISALGNGGNLVLPHYVKALVNEDGEVVQEFGTTVVRQVISKETSDLMRGIMEYEVAESGGNTAAIPGYRIGGKTGTAQKAENGVYSKTDYYSSFICMAPMDDPKITLLVVVDSPRGAIYGSVVAAPAAKNILTNVLRYMGVSPSEEAGESAQSSQAQVTVPNLVGMTYANASATLKNLGLTITRPSSAEGRDDWVIVDQYPKAGTSVAKGTIVYVYKE
ncbi:MAG: PASTA domain-containing protein [Firmicutes bacterium]|nr:PASTA domain-containing protein [Bacillota bacterium]